VNEILKALRNVLRAATQRPTTTVATANHNIAIGRPALMAVPAPNRTPPPYNPMMREELAIDLLLNPPKRISDKLLAPPKKETNMEIAAILALINGLLPLIKKCRDGGSDDDQILASARGYQGVMAIRKSNRANGLRGRRFRVANREAVDTMAAMTDEELLEQVINAPEFEKDEDGNDGLDYDLFA